MSHFYIQQWNCFCLYRRLSQQHPIFVVKETLEMKILHISDTHGCHRQLHDLPQADIVVHSGDLTMNGSEQEALDFMNWFCDLLIRKRYSFAATTMNACMMPPLTGLMAMCITCVILV